MFLQLGADPENVADEQAEGNDEECHADSKGDVDDEVRLVGVKPLSYSGNFGHEDEVEQVDVEGAHSDVLQSPTDACLPGEVGLIVTEEHHHGQHQCVHRHCFGQIGPFLSQQVPSEDVGAAEEGEDDHEGEEPFRVEEPLDGGPVSMDEIAQQKEVKEKQGLVATSDCSQWRQT